MKQIRQEFSQVSNQYSPRLEKLLMRLENQRVHMTELVALHRKEKPELAARLQSLILYSEGKPMHEIKAATGLSTSAVQRVRRRFECWGLGCVMVMDSPPIAPVGYLRKDYARALPGLRLHSPQRASLSR